MSAPAGLDGFATVGAPDPWAPLAAALRAYDGGDEAATLTVRNDADAPRPLPISHFFRPPADFSPIDREALGRGSGRALDVGAAAGAVTLPLQEQGLEVTALDPVPDAVRIMRNRGVLNARLGDVMTFRSDELFDTVLLLMNGSMIAGTLAGLERMLLHLETLLSPGRTGVDGLDGPSRRTRGARTRRPLRRRAPLPTGIRGKAGTTVPPTLRGSPNASGRRGPRATSGGHCG